MQNSTSVRVAVETRDALRALAHADHLTLDEEIVRLIRAERQRRFGDALAAADTHPEDDAWIGLGARTVDDDARR